MRHGPSQRTTQFRMLASASHISCTLIVWSFFRLTYSCSLTAGVAILTCVQSTQPMTFGKFATAWNTTFMASVSRCGWKRTCLGTTTHKSSEGCNHSVYSSRNDCLAYTKQITNWKLPHAKNCNAIRTWSVGVREPFRSATETLSPTISTRFMMSARRKRYLMYISASS